MKKFILNIKWWFWVALAVAFGVVILISKGLFTKGPTKPLEGSPDKFLPPPPRIILEKMEKAHEAALAVRAEVKADTSVKKKKLEEIAKLNDGVERREALASFLDNL